MSLQAEEPLSLENPETYRFRYPIRQLATSEQGGLTATARPTWINFANSTYGISAPGLGNMNGILALSCSCLLVDECDAMLAPESVVKTSSENIQPKPRFEVCQKQEVVGTKSERRYSVAVFEDD